MQQVNKNKETTTKHIKKQIKKPKMPPKTKTKPPL